MTAGVLLRDVTEDDLPIFFAHQIDPDAARMAAFPARERDAFMAHWARILGDGAISKQTILVAGEVAGNVVCFAQDGQPHVGYWIGREYWGRGVATAALAAFLTQCSIRRPHGAGTASVGWRGAASSAPTTGTMPQPVV